MTHDNNWRSGSSEWGDGTMENAEELTIHERLLALESTIIKQEGQIAALTYALSEALVAHAVLHQEFEPLNAIRENRDFDLESARVGGTPRTPGYFFEARGEALAELLMTASQSESYYKYWRRSSLDWIDIRRKKLLDRTRATLTALPISRVEAMNEAPRCAAKSKRTGQPCRAPAVRGWKVCRMHGARGGARPGPANPSWRHGGRSGAAVELRKLANALGREARRLAASLR